MARAMKATLSVALSVALLASAASAAGAVTCAPPGVSGVSQYVETLPGLSCNVPSPRPGHGAAPRRRGHPGAAQPAGGGGGSGQSLGGSGQTPGGSGQTPGGSGQTTGGSGQTTVGAGQTSGGSLPPATSRKLSRRGAAGQAVQRLVAQTGTAPRHRTDSSSGALGATPAALGSGRGALGGLVHPLLSGSARGGVGELLPMLLGGAVLVMLAISISRRRRRAT